MRKRYGLPYMGGKNTLSEKILEVLPKADNFVDLFCGGGAVAHCALATGKYKKVLINDLDPRIAELVYMILTGQFKSDFRWISREEFEKRKDGTDMQDVWLSLVWSFGNNRMRYLYSRELEPYKHAVWMARVEGDCSGLKALGIDIEDGSKDTIKKNEDLVRNALGLEKNYSLDSLSRVEAHSTERTILHEHGFVEADASSLSWTSGSYETIEIPENSVVYCDIPYENTYGYMNRKFEHKDFYDWARNQKELVVISSYECPEDFVPVAQFEYVSRYSSVGGKKVFEKLFVQKDKLDRFIDKNMGSFAAFVS